MPEPLLQEPQAVQELKVLLELRLPLPVQELPLLELLGLLPRRLRMP